MSPVIPQLAPPAERRRPSVQEQMHEGETENGQLESSSARDATVWL
jgi:hypothetical protein